MRGVLLHTSNHSIWYRLALTGISNMAATIFDDLTQASSWWIEGSLIQCWFHCGLQQHVLQLQPTILRMQAHACMEPTRSFPPIAFKHWHTHILAGASPPDAAWAQRDTGHFFKLPHAEGGEAQLYHVVSCCVMLYHP